MALGAADAFSWLQTAILDSQTEFSIGAFGAVGQFPKGDRATVDVFGDRIVATTGLTRLELRRHENLQLVAFETISSDPLQWNHGVAICLPERFARMGKRGKITSVGSDEQAIDVQGRETRLYDLGLELDYADICIRLNINTCPDEGTTINAETALRSFQSETWLFKTRAGYLETSHPAHRHINQSLLRSRARHAATIAIPSGLMPIGYAFPPNACRSRSCDKDQAALFHSSFQAVYDAFGPDNLVSLKRRVEAAIVRGSPPGIIGNRGALAAEEVAVIRVALRQHAWLSPCRRARAWEEIFDKPLARADEASPIFRR